MFYQLINGCLPKSPKSILTTHHSQNLEEPQMLETRGQCSKMYYIHISFFDVSPLGGQVEFPFDFQDLILEVLNHFGMKIAETHRVQF
jgi:hypothetical protein